MRNKNKKVFFAAAVLSCMMMATPVFADQEITSADTQASMPASTFDKKAAHTRDFSYELAVHIMLCHNSK